MATARYSRVLRTIPLLIVLCFISFPAYAKYSGGSGKAEDPYQIATAEDLMLLGETPGDYDKHFVLIADIDLDPNLPGRMVFGMAVIAPDANSLESAFQGTAFTGVFDGNGHTISNLTIKGGGYLGLFGKLDSGVIISNLGLEAVDVTGTSYYVAYVGGLAGQNKGSIATSYSTGTVSGNGSVGGLVGKNYGGIATSHSTGTVSGNGYVGGLVGRNYGGYITTSYSTNTVSRGDYVGGLVGQNFQGRINTSYSSGTVGGNRHVGGLVGENAKSHITVSYSTGTVGGIRDVGGLVGGTLFGSITTSYSSGAVSGDQSVGGLVGRNWLGSFTMCFWDVEISGQSSSDGGTDLTTAEMQHVNTFLNAGWDFVDEVLNGTCDYWQISPADYPRLRYHDGDSPVMPEGLGTAEEPYLIRDARDLGTVWFEPIAHYRLETFLDLSGITWSMAVVPKFGGTFDGNGYVMSDLHIQGGGYLGLFGQLSSGAEVSNLGLEAVDVNGTDNNVGGLAGYNDGSITTSYSTGTVSGDLRVGGLVGYSSGYSDGSITNCYATASVSGGDNVGGLVGFNYESDITASFWDIQTSGKATSAGGTGKTTTEMQTASTFLDAGWDFVDETASGTEDIWWILEGQDYPRLWWELIPEN